MTPDESPSDILDGLIADYLRQQGVEAVILTST